MNSNIDFENFSKQINKTIQDENEKLKVYKDILKIADIFFKKVYEVLKKSKEIKEKELNDDIKKKLCKINEELNINIELLLKKIKQSDDDDKSGTDGDNSGNIRQQSLSIGIDEADKKIYKKIEDLKCYIEKQNTEISTYENLAEIARITSELCKLASKTINTVNGINTLCSILKIAAELASLIHPLLLQLQIKIQLKIDAINIIEIKFEENFEVFVSKIIDYAIKKEIMNKENIQCVHFKIR